MAEQTPEPVMLDDAPFDEVMAAAQGIAPPPPILTLVMTTTLAGRSSIEFNMPVEHAIAQLRMMADSLEQQAAQRRTAESAAESAYRREQDEGPE